MNFLHHKRSHYFWSTHERMLDHGRLFHVGSTRGGRALSWWLKENVFFGKQGVQRIHLDGHCWELFVSGDRPGHRLATDSVRPVSGSLCLCYVIPKGNLSRTHILCLLQNQHSTGAFIRSLGKSAWQVLAPEGSYLHSDQADLVHLVHDEAPSPTWHPHCHHLLRNT